jgi:DNA repair protein RadD
VVTTLFDLARTAPDLRDYQHDGIERLRESFRTGHKRPLMSAPTGAGKTRCASEIVNLALRRGKRVAFTVPRLDLIDQSLTAFAADGIHDVGVMQGKHFLENPEARTQLISVQTLARRGFPDVDLVVCDEAHLRFEILEKWMKARPELPFVGLSATPGSRGLGLVYDDLVTVATTRQLIEQGYLSPFRVFAPTHPDLAGVKTIAGDYHEGQLAERMNTEPLVADAVETWMRLAEGRPTLVFGVDQPHAKHLQERFLAAGVPCGYQDSNTPTLERKQIRDQFHRGELKVVSNCETLLVGVDWDVRCISLCRPTKSPIVLTQIVGRGLRTAPGKLDLLLLDHTDSTLRLGFVTDIKFDKLDDGKKAEPSDPKPVEPAKPKDCPSCGFVRPARVSVCPFCGFKTERQSNVEEAEGELVELTKTQRKRNRTGFIELQGQAIPLRQFFAELQGYAAAHGYKPGWGAQKYRSAIGVWPDRWKGVGPATPSYETSSWCKAQAIRWAKGRAKQEANHAIAAD